MGLDAQIIAVSPFSRALVDVLDYPAEFYEDVPESTTVVSWVFEAPTTQHSWLLAECSGVGAGFGVSRVG